MSSGEPSGPEDLLARLEARLDRAAQAAESLIAEAGAAAAGGIRRGGGQRPPPAGWQAPADAHGPATGDIELLSQLIGSLRGLVPDDLQRRLNDALRELLVALRALIDWYLERFERPPGEDPPIEDIPIL